MDPDTRQCKKKKTSFPLDDAQCSRADENPLTEGKLRADTNYGGESDVRGS